MATLRTFRPRPAIARTAIELWAQTVARQAGLRCAADLLDLGGNHPLRKEISRAQWVRVVRGLSDPHAIQIRPESMASVVARLDGFGDTLAILRHPLFRYAEDRSPQPDVLARLMLKSPIIEITPDDWMDREWMGLVAEDDGETDLLPIHAKQFSSLDDLFVLVRAVESAHRAAEWKQAQHLERVWFDAAQAFGTAHGLGTYRSDYWPWFVQHVLAGPWMPSLPDVDERARAKEELLRQRGPSWLEPQGREPDRLRSRDILQRAMAMRTRRRPMFMYVVSEPRWRWLVSNREEVARHVAIAVDRAMGRAVPNDVGPALQMPKALFEARIAPPIADKTFTKDPSPYDLIPIQVVQESPAGDSKRESDSLCPPRGSRRAY